MKTLYAPRPVVTEIINGNYKELIGYIVDRVYLQSKQTIYYNNEPTKKTYYSGEFQGYPGGYGPICDNQAVNNLSPNQVVESYEECEKIVEKLNENFANHVRGSYDLRYDPENLITRYKNLLNKVQQQAKDAWALHPNV